MPGYNELGLRQALEEIPGGRELPSSRALRQISANDDQGRCERLQVIHQGLGDVFNDGAEVKI